MVAEWLDRFSNLFQAKDHVCCTGILAPVGSGRWRHWRLENQVWRVDRNIFLPFAGGALVEAVGQGLRRAGLRQGPQPCGTSPSSTPGGRGHGDTVSESRITERWITERRIIERRITERRITERGKLPNAELLNAERSWMLKINERRIHINMTLKMDMDRDMDMERDTDMDRDADIERDTCHGPCPSLRSC